MNPDFRNRRFDITSQPLASSGSGTRSAALNQITKLRRIACLIIVGGAIAMLGGCKADTAPSPGMGDPYPSPMNDPQISVLSPELRQWVVFQPAIITKDNKRPMTVEVPMRNTTYNSYLLEYRILFYDNAGRELSPVMGWEPVSLDPKQVVRVKRSAMSTEADNYRMEVRWSR